MLLAAGLGLAGNLAAQSTNLVFPSPSPTCTLKQRVGLTDIEIVYSRPGMKGRTIFGGLVPYGAVWRTGANASTKITFGTDVKLDGNAIPAGTYALYTIPSETEWTVILSKNLGSAGIFGYDAKDDLVRLKAAPSSIEESVETFTIDFTNVRDDSATLYLLWDKTLVPMQLEVDVTSKLLPQIAETMSAPGKKQAGTYYQAATFYFNHGQDLKKALAWLDEGLADKPRIAFELLNLKAQILAKQGDKEGAIAAAKSSTELARKADPNSSFIKMNEELISKLQ
jgi:hypothetical protein